MKNLLKKKDFIINYITANLKKNKKEGVPIKRYKSLIFPLCIILLLITGGGIAISLLVHQSFSVEGGWPGTADFTDGHEETAKELRESISKKENEKSLVPLSDLETEPKTDNNIIYQEDTTDPIFPHLIKINKQQNTITIYGLDDDGEYTVPIKAMVCSTGKVTPIGSFKTSDKYTWKVLNGNVWGQYATRITGHILFHSVPYRTNNKNDLIFSYYNKLGTTASAGCVRLTVSDAKWIIDNCPQGTTVTIYNSEEPGPLGKPEAIKVAGDIRWDPTDPDPANPWKNEKPVITGVKDDTIQKGEGYDPLAGVKAYDRFGNEITRSIVISGGMDTTVAGEYHITYKVTDILGSTVSLTAAFTVEESDEDGNKMGSDEPDSGADALSL